MSVEVKEVVRIKFFSIIIFMVTCSCSQPSYYEREISFVNPKDNCRLSGTLCLPDTEALVPAVVLIHGSGPHGRDLEIMGKHKVFKHMAHYLASKGIAVLRYDKRGTGKSQGYHPD